METFTVVGINTANSDYVMENTDALKGERHFDKSPSNQFAVIVESRVESWEVGRYVFLSFYFKLIYLLNKQNNGFLWME